MGNDKFDRLVRDARALVSLALATDNLDSDDYHYLSEAMAGLENVSTPFR